MAEGRRFNDTFSQLPTTVFEEMSLLAAKHNSTNLGQGFPDNVSSMGARRWSLDRKCRTKLQRKHRSSSCRRRRRRRCCYHLCRSALSLPQELEGPESMKKAASSALYEHSNQYPPMMGVPELRQAVAAHSRRQAGIEVDWQGEALVTVGATEALAAAFLALLNAGDEVSEGMRCHWMAVGIPRAVIAGQLAEHWAGAAPDSLGWRGYPNQVRPLTVHDVTCGACQCMARISRVPQAVPTVRGA